MTEICWNSFSTGCGHHYFQSHFFPLSDPRTNRLAGAREHRAARCASTTWVWLSVPNKNPMTQKPIIGYSVEQKGHCLDADVTFWMWNLPSVSQCLPTFSAGQTILHFLTSNVCFHLWHKCILVTFQKIPVAANQWISSSSILKDAQRVGFLNPSMWRS